MSRLRKAFGVLVGGIVAVILAVLGVQQVAGSGSGSGSGSGGQVSARVLACGSFDFPSCANSDDQFDSAFPAASDEKGFGGGSRCDVDRTPVVFVHGNADRSVNWDSAITGAVANNPEASGSVYDTFRAAGYNGCELYGFTFLTESEQKLPQLNYHKPAKYTEILDFIHQVQAFTGAAKVDVVAHSLGVSMTLAALTWHDETGKGAAGWADVRRFVNIAGGLHGLSSCAAVGFANPAATTCGSQNLVDPYVFGFYQGANEWTGGSGKHSLRAMPTRHPAVDFYTVHAGTHDQVHCGTVDPGGKCAQGALFTAASNVKAQLDVGAGSTTKKLDLNITDGSLFAISGGDVDGVGHFKAKNNTGAIVVSMLTTDCTGKACAADYHSGPATSS